MSLLLRLSQNPKVDNYVIILWGFMVSPISVGPWPCSFDIGQPYFGSCVVFGGVRFCTLLWTWPRTLTSKQPVIFQQPRPGPKLQKGENYLTIGWKQVCNTPFLMRWADSKIDLCCFEGVQKIITHIRLYTFYLSRLWCVCNRYSSPGLHWLDGGSRLRVSRWCRFAKMINSRSHFFRIRILTLFGCSPV